jgi:transposase
MVKLFARGLSYRKISKILNTSLFNVKYWAKRISKEEIEIERAKIQVEQQTKLENYWLEEEQKLKEKSNLN